MHLRRVVIIPLLAWASALCRKKRKGGSDKNVPRTTFADVAGVGAAKEELAEVGL